MNGGDVVVTCVIHTDRCHVEVLRVETAEHATAVPFRCHVCLASPPVAACTL